ncbi:MAG: hypothetical protein KGJ40_04655, partial [candidate division NC10 bacterium]|nr:hypothetical protein [candidate division NC10 bacterium]
LFLQRHVQCANVSCGQAPLEARYERRAKLANLVVARDLLAIKCIRPFQDTSGWAAIYDDAPAGCQ